METDVSVLSDLRRALKKSAQALTVEAAAIEALRDDFVPPVDVDEVTGISSVGSFSVKALLACMDITDDNNDMVERLVGVVAVEVVVLIESLARFSC